MPRILVFVLACLILLAAVTELWPQEQEQKQSYVIPPADLNLQQELSQLSQAPLASLFYNLAQIHELSSLEVADVSYSLEEDRLVESAVDSQWGIDRIGKYYKIKLMVTGDLLEQVYVLRLLQSDFSRSLLIQSIEADNSQMIVSGRLYGALQ